MKFRIIEVADDGWVDIHPYATLTVLGLAILAMAFVGMWRAL